MLLSVAEAAKILELKPKHIYYRLEFCKVDGAIKIGRIWRIDEESVREWYERVNATRARIFPGFAELVGFEATIENIRKASLQTNKTTCFTRVSRRGQGVDSVPGGSDTVAGNSGRQSVKLTQLTLF